VEEMISSHGLTKLQMGSSLQGFVQSSTENRIDLKINSMDLKIDIGSSK